MQQIFLSSFLLKDISSLVDHFVLSPKEKGEKK